MRRQDLSKQYQEAGSVYAMKTSKFLKKKNRFFGEITMHEIPRERVYEIDDTIDYNIALKILSLIEKPQDI